MSQINFFMNEKDEIEFFDMIFKRKDTLVLNGIFYDSPNPKPISKISRFGKAGKLVFTNLKLNVFPLLEKNKVQFEDKYTFDLFKDAHLEFLRCYYYNDVLVSGRIFAKIGWLKTKENNKIYKSWYTSIERWIKKKYKQIDKLWWIGPNAEQWSFKGGKLAFGHPNAMAKSLSDCVIIKK